MQNQKILYNFNINGLIKAKQIYVNALILVIQNVFAVK